MNNSNLCCTLRSGCSAVLLLLAVLMANPTFAAAELDELFPRSRVMYDGASQVNDYHLYLSAPRKINNQWRFERSERLSGELRRRTLEVQDDLSFAETRQRIERFFEHFDSRQLFSCGGLDCGSSNVWANEVFKVKQLYGLDQTQYYSAWEFELGQRVAYGLAYLAQRGNGRVYLQLDWLTAPPGSEPAVTTAPATVLNQLLDAGFYAIPGKLDDPAGNPHLQAIATALKLRPGKRFYVVGHDFGRGSEEERKARSKALAEAVRAQLLNLGVREQQVQAEGIGALAPRDGMRRQMHAEIVLAP